MLKLKGITKTYRTTAESVEALRGIDLEFRDSEFVAILGQSGCGKTTLLNIVGGLDQYTDGDLIINGKSTRDFKDRDWDTYRNHSVGFVFQSYNLIPHQTILQNVELALTLSGVKKTERRERAIKALKEVGLKAQMKKKPSELSGGQMQRVAIARAIVNNPDIILADEPTGALDSETSVQVMEILKEIAKDRLIVMVTHNPELAEKYATRTIRILDGLITDDSNPLTAAEYEAAETAAKQRAEEEAKKKKPSMSLFTSFGLSLKNLFSKKGRTILTSVAGSIGIIGIALIFAVSQGTTNYINAVQEETLSSYPLTLEEQHVSLESLLKTFIGAAQANQEHERDAVYQKMALYNLTNALENMEAKKNDLGAFKDYLEKRISDTNDTTGLRKNISGVQYTYSINPQIYTENVDGKIVLSDSDTLLGQLIAENMGISFASSLSGMGEMSAMMSQGSSSRIWQEMLPGTDGKPINDILYKQYDLIYGAWPNSYDEVVLVVDRNNEIDDMTLYALGLRSKEDISAVMKAAMSKQPIPTDLRKWTYEEICNMQFRMILNADCYVPGEGKTTPDLRDTEAGLKLLYDRGTPIRITGIIRPNPDASSTMLTGSIAYTHLMTEYVIQHANDSEVVKAQKELPERDVLTGLRFRPDEDSMSVSDKAALFDAMLQEMSTVEKARMYVEIQSTPPEEMVQTQLQATLGQMTREDMENAMLGAVTAQTGMSDTEIREYLSSVSDEEMAAMMAKGIEEQIRAAYAQKVSAGFAMMTEEQLAAALDAAAKSYDEESKAQYFSLLPFSKSSYKSNLAMLGVADLGEPTSINLYASTFAGKDIVKDAITSYNEGVQELSRIEYTDYVGIMMSSITTIIDAITYVLISFVAVSLVVSSIMIGVITLISVQERTKEIGILRAIGASKRNVSSMFNAETVIIGFLSGVTGVVVTYLLCVPINAILHAVTGLGNLSAYLPPVVAGILVCISVFLTLIAGIIPSGSAAKKDPVVALRTE